MANIEAGTYRARAVEGALGLTSGGKEQVAVKFDLLDFPGQAITWFGYFTEKTTNSTFKALRTAGWKGADLADLSDLSNPENPEVYLVVELETYQDKTIAKVRWVNSAGGLAMTNSLQGDQAKAFAAKMREKLAAFDAVTKAQSGSASAPKKAAPSRVPQHVLDAQEGEHSDEPLPF